MRLADVAEVTDASEDIRNNGLVNGKPGDPALRLACSRERTSSRRSTRVRAILPQLQADIPPTIALQVGSDRTTTIRASVHEVQFTLMLSRSGLVILVVFVFLRDVRTSMIPMRRGAGIADQHVRR